jgi:esterase/lipase superfamily enzyme
MRVLNKRLIIGIFFIASLVIVAVVAGYIGRNFLGHGQIPTRSAFTSRLPSSQTNPQQYRFFYATNRVNDEVSLNNQGHQLANTITSGTFDVRISSYLPIQPWVWFDTDYMEWLGHQIIPKDQFLLQLRKAVQASPKKSVLIVVWGFRDWFKSAALKTAYTAYVLDINTPVVLFDWPGNQGEGIRGYNASRKIATQSAADLGSVLSDVINKTGAEKIWIIGSSLGCQTICDSMDWLATQPDIAKGEPKIDHIVLSAPDVSAQAFNENFAEKIQALSRHLTAYVSSNDRALLMSYWLNGSRPLGRKSEVAVPPETRIGQYEFEEGLELLELQVKGAKNFTVVDATPINRTRNLHHFFTDSPEFFDDLFRRLLQPENNLSRPLYPLRTKDGANYWVLWNN